MKWLGYTLATVVFLSVSASAQKFDRFELLEATRRNCPIQFMKDKRFIDILLLGGGNLSAFCECFSVRFVAQLDDGDYGIEAALNLKWTSSQNFCLAVSMK